ncbi:MAG: hypothetical protein ACTSWM_07270 [Alphaproteobacteria bacterium]
MTRDATAAAILATEASHVRIGFCVELDFDSGSVRCNSFDRDLSFEPDPGGPVEVFKGVGDLGSITGLGETSDLRASRAEVTLSGISDAVISLAFENAQGRRGRVWLALLDDNYALIDAPVLFYEGLMDNSQIKVGEDNSVTIPINNRLIEWERPSALLYTDQDQQALYPGDRFFEFVQQTSEKELLWGFGGTGQVPQGGPAVQRDETPGPDRGAIINTGDLPGPDRGAPVDGGRDLGR